MNLMTKEVFPVEVSVRGGRRGKEKKGKGDGETGEGVTDRLNGSPAQQSFASSRCRQSLERVGGEGEESRGSGRINGMGEGL